MSPTHCFPWWIAGLATLLLCSPSAFADATVDTSLTTNAATSTAYLAHKLKPQDTGPDITLPTSSHYVVLPPAQIPRKDVLIVFLPGSFAQTGDYEKISQRFAHNGYSVIDLSYDNSTDMQKCDSDSTIVATQDICYFDERKAISFGRDKNYDGTIAQSAPLPYANFDDVLVGDSIVHLLVSAIDTLRHEPANPKTNPDPIYWDQFLIRSAANSPYLVYNSDLNANTDRRQPVYPNWSKIILAGHSQGAGHAAYIAMMIPVPVRRVLMFSGPEDYNSTAQNPKTDPAKRNSVPWLSQSSSTPLSSFWGLRSSDGTQQPSNGAVADLAEKLFGERAVFNWDLLGGAGLDHVHRLTIRAPSTFNSFKNHNSTAVDYAIDDPLFSDPPIYQQWDQMLQTP